MDYQCEDKRLVIDYLNATGTSSWFRNGQQLSYDALSVPYPIWDAVADQHLKGAIEWKRRQNFPDEMV